MISKQQIKFVNSLKRVKNRWKSNCFIVEGATMVRDLLESNWSIVSIYATEDWCKKNPGIDCQIISKQQLEKISTFKTPNQVISIVEIHDTLYSKQELKNIDKIILLDNISDPGNMGTIIRTADWFGIKKIYITNNCVDIYNPKVIQSSMGSIFRVQIAQVEYDSFLYDINRLGIKSYGTSLSGKNVYEIDFPKQCVIVFGNESHGISAKNQLSLDEMISIPSKNSLADSLNVSISFGIIISLIR